MFNAEEAERGEVCDNAQITVSTRVSKLVLLAKRDIKWTVEDMELFKWTLCIRKHKFDFEIEKKKELPNLKFEVHLEPGYCFFYDSYDTDNKMHVYFQLIDGKEHVSPGQIFVKMKLEVLTKEGTVWIAYDTENYSSKKIGNVLDIVEMASINSTRFTLQFPPRVRLPITADGSLVFRLVIELFTHRLLKTFEQVQVMNSDAETYMLNTFESRARADKIRTEGKMTDVEVISSDGKKFQFHMELLIAKSPVFEAMFHSNMMESVSGVINLDDICQEGVQLLHYFIYNGKMRSILESFRNGGNEKELGQWIYIASKYQFDDLLQFFDQMMGTMCKMENAIQLLRLSNRFSLKGAREDVKAFICKHPEALDNV